MGMGMGMMMGDGLRRLPPGQEKEEEEEKVFKSFQMKKGDGTKEDGLLMDKFC